jgi:hypothetical protein
VKSPPNRVNSRFRPGHFGRDRRESFPFPIRACGIAGQIPVVLPAKRVFAHADGDPSGKPEGAAESCIAPFGQRFSTARGPGLGLCQIQPAVFQELSVMCKAANITRFGEDGERKHGTDPRNRAEVLIPRVIAQ